MRAIAEPFYDASAAMAGPVVALVFFLVVFVAVLVHALRARSAELATAASLPLHDDDRTPTARPAGARDEMAEERVS